MSKRTKAIASVRGAAKAAGGAHLTRQARAMIMTRLVDTLYDRGIQVTGIDGLRERHIVAYLDARKDEGVRIRTLQNEASAIRTSLSASDRKQAAASKGLSNDALGISGGSRMGTNTAATLDQFTRGLQAAYQRDPGLAVCLKLERTLGLRGAEAVHSCKSLRDWEKQLAKGERVYVLHGTKGGRPRYSQPADREKAVEAVREARLLAKQRGGHLLEKASLKQAYTYYRNSMHRYISPAAGATPHALRYAYTRDLLAHYEAEGHDRAEALSITSTDLGHGDGRGRFVEDVYGQ
jgi:hypothetical protein